MFSLWCQWFGVLWHYIGNHPEKSKSFHINWTWWCCLLIIITIIIQANSVVSNTNGFINFWLRFFDTKRETYFLRAYANHTMLTPPPTCSASCDRDLKKFSGPSLPGMMSSTYSIHSNGRPALFPVWEFMTDDDCHILFTWV